MRRLAFLALAAIVMVAGCRDSGAGGDAAVTAVATTTQVADLVHEVGGPRVSVDGILRPNSDPHEYEPRPSDAAALTRAELVFRSGGDLDGWLDQVVDNAGGDARQVTLIDSVRRLGDDPHWWQDPVRAEKAATAIGRAFAAAGLPDRSAAYVARLKRLDAGVRACMDKVPAGERKLVTSHDALGYYAKRYDIRVIGAVIPALTTAAQPSAGDVANLVATIRREGVKTIFAESSVNPKVEEAIARETGAKIGKALWADSLGPTGSDGATYISSIEANTRALVQGFTGGAVDCPVDA